MSKKARYQTVIMDWKPIILDHPVHELDDELDIKSIKKRLSSIEEFIESIKMSKKALDIKSIKKRLSSIENLLKEFKKY